MESSILNPSETKETLLARVRLGNDKLMAAYLSNQKLEDIEEFNKQRERVYEAAKKLRALCDILQMQFGFRDCLYINDSGKKIRTCKDEPDGSFCWVCPSQKPYWWEELWAKDGMPLKAETQGELLSDGRKRITL